MKKTSIKINRDELFKREGDSSRISKDRYYLEMAKTASMRSTCLRRRYGAIIVKNDKIISTGYNGSPMGTINCCDKGVCLRQEKKVLPGQRYELCRSVHAEQNAIISASGQDMVGATIYIAGFDIDTDEITINCEPCMMCRRQILNAQIIEVVMILPNSEIIRLKTSALVDKENNL